MPKSLFFLFIAFSVNAVSQEKVSIADPEIKFNYNLAAGWAYSDDGYVHKAFVKSKPNDGQITITYFEQTYPPFKDIYDGFIQIQLPMNHANLNILEQGSATIDGTDARWVHYTFADETDKSLVKEGIYYLYYKINQVFYLSFEAPADAYQQMISAARASILSFQAVRK